MHHQSPGAVQGPGSIRSSQHIYGLITRQTVFNFLKCYMLCVLLLSRSKKGDHGTAFESDKEGGAESLWNSFFSKVLGDGERPAHSATIVVTEQSVPRRIALPS